MAAAVSNVVPIRWTARGFLRAGVLFYTEGGIMRVRGPENRDDLFRALVDEVTRRVDVFVKFAPLDASLPFPPVALPGVDTRVRSGACESCSDVLDRGGMCPLCILALQRTLRQLGRLK